MDKWYASAVFYKKAPSGVFVFLVMDTKSLLPKYKDHPAQTKFVGGGEKEGDRDVLVTLRREILEETDLSLPSDFSPELIHTDGEPEHFKNFYLIPFEALKGELRRTVKTMEHDKMFPPYWIGTESAKTVLFPTHRKALEKSLLKLQAK